MTAAIGVVMFIGVPYENGAGALEASKVPIGLIALIVLMLGVVAIIASVDGTGGRTPELAAPATVAQDP